MVLTVTALQQESVMKSITVAVFALLAGALMLSNQEALASNRCDDGFGNTAACSLSRIRTKGWIELHRPDGEVVHIQVDQIVLVMSATNASANKRAQSRVQLANGFADVLESVDQVMQAILKDDSIG
ncbi:MAG: hypothetical protein WBX77_07230 [Pseudolabrys sp.]|jgi:hypothetical protein